VHLDTFAILRCPYCGGQLELVDSLFHRADADEIYDGVIACQCCVFPIVDGIPIMHLLPAGTTAREQIEAGRPDLARRTLFGLDDPGQAEIFERVASSPDATYRETVDAIGPNFEGGYFLYRFSDPTFMVAQPIVRAVASTVLDGRRAIDICGGSGHLTRSLLDLSAPRPVLADLYYAKVWLARRFTAPGCEPVCCDANAPLPFARGAFGFAMCVDAFMYVWTKRQLANEMERLVDAADPGAIVISHTHNQRAWSPSHGQTLTHEGYAALFERLSARVFAEARLFADIVDRGVIDLSRVDPPGVLDADPALTLVASRRGDVFTRHAVEPVVSASGEWRLNPLYAVDSGFDGATLTLRFPDDEYAQEYGACRRYLPDRVSVSRAQLDALPAGAAPAGLADLVRRRVVLDLPARYY